MFGRHDAHVVGIELGAQLGQQRGDVDVGGPGVQRRVGRLQEVRDDARVVGRPRPQVQLPDGRAALHRGAMDDGAAAGQRDQHGPQPSDGHRL